MFSTVLLFSQSPNLAFLVELIVIQSIPIVLIVSWVVMLIIAKVSDNKELEQRAHGITLPVFASFLASTLLTHAHAFYINSSDADTVLTQHLLPIVTQGLFLSAMWLVFKGRTDVARLSGSAVVILICLMDVSAFFF